jgi:hypothetical protein
VSKIEAAALIILVAGAAALLIIGAVGWWLDRRPDIELPPAPEPPSRYDPRHADWGETTRLRPPD